MTLFLGVQGQIIGCAVLSEIARGEAQSAIALTKINSLTISL
ncbi:hypothetical protein H1P_340015 [Hyella patelloides LEGE 07179]|uniref:Uncharacterized protein n=1 Tax=Hyella patelloides LEGE 07179 TaxID=945734 RepID=A0A563VVK9_9CYAN|nr:hypothetical protein [Hyella patelloides]VEP15489.1 hypothetical protein H1P_340015 [Hyella patelloides LEGE 07179]